MFESNAYKNADFYFESYSNNENQKVEENIEIYRKKRYVHIYIYIRLRTGDLPENASKEQALHLCSKGDTAHCFVLPGL